MTRRRAKAFKYFDRDAAFSASLYPKPRRDQADTTARETIAPIVSVRPRARPEADTFHLIVMDDFREDENGRRVKDAPSPDTAQVLATYGGARVASLMRLRNAVATARAESVVLWDVDGMFPSLDHTIGALNDAQTVFGFRLEGLSAPLDAWDLDTAEGQTFLWAEKASRRLQATAASLNADLLVCVTRHWLRSDEWLYLYGWWPDHRTPPVAFLSVAGVEELKPEGPETDRAMANALVTCLAGFYGEIGTHESGAKNGPLAFNESRAFAHLVGEQRFDAQYRRKLAGPLGDKRKALDALLTAFSAG